MKPFDCSLCFTQSRCDTALCLLALDLLAPLCCVLSSCYSRKSLVTEAEPLAKAFHSNGEGAALEIGKVLVMSYVVIYCSSHQSDVNDADDCMVVLINRVSGTWSATAD